MVEGIHTNSLMAWMIIPMCCLRCGLWVSSHSLGDGSVKPGASSTRIGMEIRRHFSRLWGVRGGGTDFYEFFEIMNGYVAALPMGGDGSFLYLLKGRADASPFL